ncbi:MAG: MerR family transcriptional regulator [Pseudonocardiaceae bacterium]
MSAASALGPDPSHGSGRASWTAGAVARLLGMPASTLRSWHRRYGIGPTGHHAGRHRRYTDTDLAALARMQHLITGGMSTESAAHLAHRLPGPLEAPLDSPVRPDELLTAALQLDVDTVLFTLGTHLITYGVIATWEELCRPALTDLTHRFTANDPDQCIDVEHLLSWAITTALHRAPAPPAQPFQPVLLACADREHHTLPLEALRAALAQHAVPTRIFGAAAPTTALQCALHRAPQPPVALVLWAHTSNTADPRALDSLAETGIAVIAAGPGWDHSPLPPQVAHPTSLRAAFDLLSPPQHDEPPRVR